MQDYAAFTLENYGICMKSGWTRDRAGCCVTGLPDEHWGEDFPGGDVQEIIGLWNSRVSNI